MSIRKAVIPLAGLGTRLLPLTKSVPKELLPVARKPVIQYVVEELVNAGIQQILLVTSKRNVAFEDYFADDPSLIDNLIRRGKQDLLEQIDFNHLECRFMFAHQNIAAGIGDAVLLAEDFVGNEAFVLHMGDSIIMHDQGFMKRMIDLYEKYNAGGTIGIAEMPEEEIRSHGMVIPESDHEGGWFAIREEISYRNIDVLPNNYGVIGRYIYNANIFDAIRQTGLEANGKYDLTRAKRIFMKQGEKILAVKLSPEEKFCNAGDYETYFKTFLDFVLEDREYGEMLKKYLKQRLSIASKTKPNRKQ